MRIPDIWWGLNDRERNETHDRLVRLHALTFPAMGGLSCSQWLASNWPGLNVLDATFADRKMVQELVRKARRSSIDAKAMDDREMDEYEEKQMRSRPKQRGHRMEKAAKPVQEREFSRSREWNVNQRQQSLERLRNYNNSNHALTTNAMVLHEQVRWYFVCL